PPLSCAPHKNEAKDLTLIDQKDWASAELWFNRIQPLLLTPRTADMVKAIAREAGVHPATVYRKLALYEQSGRVSDLTPAKPNGGKGQSRLLPEAEAIVGSLVKEVYLSQQKRSIKKTNDEIRRSFAKTTNNLACDFLLGDRSQDLPFWYLRVVREHLDRGAHKVSDQEIVSIVDYVRHGGDQPTTEELRPFISREVLKRARRAGLIKRKEYLGLCPHCHATKRQFKSGLSAHRTQQFRCGECRRVYQLDYQTGRTRPRHAPTSWQLSPHDCQVASV
ncbi:MAG TPA: hypothetical protein VJ124_16270, partial [Pyrinomonadaceae bacterium]|nr:hypothetical protein [Pyrinomonadaceae bacterium]